MKLNLSRNKIMRIMARQGIGIGELGERMSVTKQYASLMANKATATPKAAGRLARGLGVDISEILED